MRWLFFEAGDLAPAQGQAYRSMHYAPVKDALGVRRCVNETLRLYEVRSSGCTCSCAALITCHVLPGISKERFQLRCLRMLLLYEAPVSALRHAAHPAGSESGRFSGV